MIKLPISILALLIVCGCATTSVIQSATFEELEYGIASINVVGQNDFEGSPTDERSFGKNFKWVSKTDSVEAKLDATFGCTFKVHTSKSINIPLKMVWVLPETMHSDINNTSYDSLAYTITVPSNQWRYEVYRLEKEFEVIKGKWIFKIYMNNKLVNRREFELY